MRDELPVFIVDRSIYEELQLAPGFRALRWIDRLPSDARHGNDEVLPGDVAAAFN
jgi:hypothetical protein